MTNLEKIAGQILKNWSGKTLASFRAQAAKEANGTAFESMRPEGGPRMMVAVCVTAPELVRVMERVFKMLDDIPPVDWNTFTLADLLMGTGPSGLSYQDLRGPDNIRTAVILCAAGPDSMKILETVFTFPE